MSVWHVQSHYAGLKSFAGFDPDEMPTVSKILSRLKDLIIVRTEATPAGVPGYMRLEKDGRHTLVISSFVKTRKRDEVKSHEVGEWWLGRSGYAEDPDIEQASNALGLLIRSPRQAVITMSRQTYPENFETVARSLQISEFEAAFRVAEERSLPVAALRRSDAYFAGPAFEWGPLSDLRDLARRLIDQAISHPLIRAARAHDERALTLVWAE